VDALHRPHAAVVPLALEATQTFEVRHARRREIPRCHDAEARRDRLALGRLQGPAIERAVKSRLANARVELHVAHEIKALGYMIDVGEDLRLSRVALRPAPLLLQLVVERVGVFEAFDIATRAWIFVPEPCAADA